MKITKTIELEMPEIEVIYGWKDGCLKHAIKLEVNCEGIGCEYCALQRGNLQELLKQQREDK